MISGGRPLRGSVQISGAKNSAVALIPAAILAETEVVLDNLPELSDVATYMEILMELGGQVSWEGSCLRIDPSRMISVPMHNGPVKKLRASYYLMARFWPVRRSDHRHAGRLQFRASPDRSAYQRF